MPEQVMEMIPQQRDALAVEQSRFLPVMPMQVAIQRRQTIAEAVKTLMVEGQDYGYISTPDRRRAGEKPFLHQPGAQKLDNLFGLVPRFIVENAEEDWTGERHGGEPFFRYFVKCQLWRGDVIMGEAIGECNSWEQKYRWRTGERTCPDCGVASIIRTKKKTWWCAPFKGGCGSGFALTDDRVAGQSTGRVPNPDIFDQVNTLIKMAQKRAHVAATINATSGSELFSQDPEAVGGSEEPAAAASEVEVPTELAPYFANLKGKGVAGDMFAFIREQMILAGKEEGESQYNELCRPIKQTYPDGRGVPLAEFRKLALMLWDALVELRAKDVMEHSEEPLTL